MTLDMLVNWSKKGNKIAIFCAGKSGIATYEIFRKCGVLVDCFFDNDPRKLNKEIIDGCFSRNIELVKDKDKYIVFIRILDHRYYELEEEVRNKGFNNIVDFTEIFDDIIANHSDLYKKLITWFQSYPLLEMFYIKPPNTNSNASRYRVLTKKRIAVYTNVTGRYDNIYQPKIKPDNIDYYFISDDENSEMDGFTWMDAKKFIPDNIISPIKRNRYVKMHPHMIFPNYDYSIYVDGNIEIEKDISSFIRESNTGISVFMHPKRDCIFYEAITIANFKRASVLDVNKQMERYLKEGMPLHYGLPEMSVIAREHNNPICKKIMNEWWNEFDNGTQRDQLSFMYVMWKNNMRIKDISSLGDDFRKSEYLKVKEHRTVSYEVKNGEEFIGQWRRL